MSKKTKNGLSRLEIEILILVSIVNVITLIINMALSMGQQRAFSPMLERMGVIEVRSTNNKQSIKVIESERRAERGRMPIEGVADNSNRDGCEGCRDDIRQTEDPGGVGCKPGATEETD